MEAGNVPSKKYSNGRRKEKTGGDNEIFGIVLVILSAFILLCIFIPPILGSISKKVIFPVVTGIFGFFAYPLFLCTLLLGIALIQGRKTNLSARYKAGIICMAISLLLILQLATTHSILGYGFGSYLSHTYRKLSAGGVVFGIFAYGIQRAVTPVVSYILYSVAFLSSLYFFLLRPIYAKRRNSKATENAFESNPFVKGKATPQQIRPLNDNTLFVDTIRTSQLNDAYPPISELSGAADMPPVAAVSKSNPIQPTKSNIQFQSYSKTSSASSDFKSDAHKILFGEQQKYLSDIAAQQAATPKIDYKQAQNEYRAGYTLPPLTSAAPDIKDTTAQPIPQPTFEKPPKRVHISDIPGLGEVPMLPPKDFSAQIVGGEGIINGDDLSRQLAETMLPKDKDKDIVERPSMREFNTKKVEISSVYPKESVQEEDDRPSIVNGDYFRSPEKMPERTKSSSYATPAGIYNTQTSDTAEARQEQLSQQEPAFTAPPVGPIISGSQYTPQESVESRFQQLLNEDRKRANTPLAPRQSPDPIIEEPEAIPQKEEAYVPDSSDLFADLQPEEDTALLSDTLPEQPRASAFRIIEDPIDLSEQSHFEGEDSTGYYESVSVSNMKPVRADPTPVVRSANQLKIDDYVASTPVPAKPKKKRHVKYHAPDIDMLIASDVVAPENYNVACEEKARLLEETLQGLKLPVKVGAITRGPAVTRYELEMPPGIPIKRIEQFSTDIEYYLESNGKIRIEAPIPGKRAVGIEVPNEKIDIVCLRDIIASKEFQNSSSPLTLSLGKDIAGSNIICNLEKMPHLLIAGATGSGKSACLNSIIISIMYKSSPEDVRLILIDPKRVEFNLYQGIPHLLSSEIINDAQQAINALTWAKEEMDRRYILFGSHKVRNLPEFNKCEAVKTGEEQKLPYIVLIVDELAELMLDNNKKVLETKIMSMAQKARAAGIHLILATQRPSVDVITGTIKANLPSRIAFSVKSIVDSRTILDQCGAETLLGRGDMLYAPIGLDDPKRVQGAFVTEQEITAVTEFVRTNNETDFDDEFTAAITKRNDEAESDDGDDDNDKEFDSLMPDVLKCVIESGSASTSMIQRRFSVGYARASRIIDQMETHKFIGPLEGSKPRAVYISREQYKELFGIDL